MEAPPPILHDQEKRDADQLKLLAIFHFVFAGLSLLGIGFLLLHYTIFSKVLNHPEVFKQMEEGASQIEGNPDPAELLEFVGLFKWFYVVFGVWMIIGIITNLLSGLWLRSKRYRNFSIVIAAINCIKLPLGTALGVFTIIVLTRDSVRESYKEKT